MADTIPLFFTLPPSNRHEIILLDTSGKLSLKSLNKQITSTIAASPNCEEFMAKHKAADAPRESIQEFKMHWDNKSRDAKVWPEYTLVTEENFAAVVAVLKGDARAGVLEIKTGKGE